MRVAVLLVALVACKDIPNEQPSNRGSGSGSDLGTIPTPKPQFEVAYEKLPDEADWKSAARVVVGAWSEAFNKQGASAVRVTPLEHDGAIAKYLFRVEALKGATSLFKGTGLVSNGVMINGSGDKRLEAHFKAIGFPKTQMPIGHLITMLHVARALDAEWTPLPDTYDWKFDGKAKLAYDDKGALLTLYRDGKHIDVRIDNDGLITKSAVTD